MIRLTTFLLLICSILPIYSAAASGQDGGPSRNVIDLSTTRLGRASEVLAHAGKLAGVTVLTDSTLIEERLPTLPADLRVSQNNLDEVIAALVNFLPEGSTWAKLYLPSPPADKEWRGDDVVAYARAQAKLYGTVGKPGPTDSIEILSQRLAYSRAKPIIEALNLKPVYVVTAGRPTYTGTWNSTFGEMHLRQNGNRVTGTYTYSDGHIDGRIVGNTMQFTWVERDTGGQGLGIFTLSEDGSSITGQWTSGGDDPRLSGSSWTGSRISRRP